MVAADVGVNVEEDFLQWIESTDFIANSLDETFRWFLITCVVFVFVFAAEEESFLTNARVRLIFVFDFDQFFASARTALSAVRKEIHVTALLLQTEGSRRVNTIDEVSIVG